ncbi:MAG: monofunctional biosynthetic peptidoglycan transglycosylase [Pseudoruegeria sp.]
MKQKPAASKKKAGAKSKQSTSDPTVRSDFGLLCVFIGRVFSRVFGFVFKWVFRAALVFYGTVLFFVLLYAVFSPPTTPFMLSEAARLGGIQKDWVDIEDMSPYLARSVVAAEDANYCLHWGFDVSAIRSALESGGNRGASTITQQTVKNVYLWHGRSWPRKALEALITPVVELVWSKKRILEVYLNVIEFDKGVFGAEAGSQTYFDRHSGKLNAQQSALMAAVLPNPKERSAGAPATWLRKRAKSIADGAATIQADGRSACFES